MTALGSYSEHWPLSESDMTACKRVFYAGKVQGVGFRYTARSVAQGFEISGFVRNLADGRVELHAEGAEAEVTGFLDALAERMSAYVRELSVFDEPPQGLSGFEIRP